MNASCLRDTTGYTLFLSHFLGSITTKPSFPFEYTTFAILAFSAAAVFTSPGAAVPPQDPQVVQFVASDGHDCKHRPPSLDEAYGWVRDEHGDAVAQRLFTLNPAAALEGQPLPEPAAATKKSCWRR